MSNKNDFVLIQDRTINLESKDLLGTKIYSDALYNLIVTKEDNAPITVGLFGNWGSGKSSIVDTFISRLNVHNEIITLTYDAWKYSNDAFRRSFIMELVNSFNLEFNKEELRLYHDISEETDYKLGISNKGLVTALLYSPLLFLLAWFTTISADIKIIFSVIGTLCTAILNLLNGFFIQYKTSVSKPKFFSPEQFEEIFNEIINLLTEKNSKSITKWIKQQIGFKNKARKVVIVIDNIDRCDKNTATELLLTIKNFLEREDCIFIIPVDDEALKRHLNFDKNSEGEEFLRKIFNVSVRIKKFNNKDLFEYTNSTIIENGLGFSSEIADIVSQEFSKNPRRIIQFLNNLSLEKQIAVQQERAGLLPQDSVTTNLDFLAKLLLIKEEWHDLFDKINNTPNILSQLNHKIINNDYTKEEQQYVFEGILGLEKLELSYEEFLFLKRTVTIDSKRVELFLRIQDYEREYPDNIKDLILSQDWDGLKQLLSNNIISIEKLFGLIEGLLDESINKHRLIETRGYNLISLIFIINNDPEYEASLEKINHRFGNYINDAQIKKIIGKFNVDALIKYSKKLADVGNYNLRGYILNEIDTNESEVLLQTFIKYNINDSETLSLIRGKFSKELIKDIGYFAQNSKLFNKKEIASALVSGDVFDHYIDYLHANSEDSEEVIEFIKKAEELSLLSDAQKSDYVDKITSFFTANNNDFTRMNFIFESLTGMLRIENNNLSSLYDILSSKADFLYQQYFSNINKNQIVIKANMNIIILLGDVYKYSSAVNIDAINKIQKYLNPSINAFYSQAIITFENIVEYFEVYDWPFSQSIINMYSSITDSEDKKVTITLLAKMLKLVVVDKEKYNGLDEEQIRQSVDILFAYLFENSPDNAAIVEEVIRELITLIDIKFAFVEKIKSITDYNQQKILIKIISKIDDESVISLIINNLVTAAKESDALNETIIIIKENVDNHELHLKNIVKELLDSVTTKKIDYYKNLLSVAVVNENLFNKIELGTIIEKIIPLLASDNKEQKLFAIQHLNIIEELPKRKLGKINALIEDLSFENKEHEKMLQQLKLKVK